MTTLTDDIVEQVQQLVRLETRYLNNSDLDSWIALFADDGYYWMPLEETQEDPESHDSLVYDNKTLMNIRKNNLGHPLSPSMQHPVRSVRMLSDIDVSQDEHSDDIIVTAAVIAVINHSQQNYYAGKVSYRFRHSDAGYRIQCKRVDLINADAPLDIIMMYI